MYNEEREAEKTHEKPLECRFIKKALEFAIKYVVLE